MPAPYQLKQPVDLLDARMMARELAKRRREAREQYENALILAADAHLKFRRAKKQAWLHAEGRTAEERKVDAENRAAEAEKEHALQEGWVKARQELLREIDADRASLHKLMEWSMKLDAYAQEDRSPDGGSRDS